MSLPVFYASNPLTTPSQSYNKIWIEKVEIDAPSPDKDAIAIVRLRRFYTSEDGTVYTEPESIKMQIDNILTYSAQDPDLANTISTIMGYVFKVGVARGIIQNPDPNIVYNAPPDKHNTPINLIVDNNNL
jgi:hypothetical protein